MRFKRFLPKILLIIGFLLIPLIIKYQGQLKDILSFNLDKFKIYAGNLFYELSPQPKRRKPLSLLGKETELKLYIGEPFNSFTRDDWDWFWNLIYGAFPYELAAKEGLPKKMRQLAPEEIANELMSRYPQPFSYFKESHWELFFGIALKK